MAVKEERMSRMLAKYPYILTEAFDGKVVYTLQADSPGEIIEEVDV